MHFAKGIGQVNAESEQWRIQPKITFLFINIFYSEFHHSKIEIEALLFHPGSFFPRRLYKIEKSAQQKGLYFSDILPRSPGAGVSDLRSPLISAFQLLLLEVSIVIRELRNCFRSENTRMHHRFVTLRIPRQTWAPSKIRHTGNEKISDNEANSPERVFNSALDE